MSGAALLGYTLAAVTWRPLRERGSVAFVVTSLVPAKIDVRARRVAERVAACSA